MKHFNKIALLLMTAVFLAILPSANTLKVSAAEPTTYIYAYDDNDGEPHGWFLYVNDSTTEEARATGHWEPYYLQQDFKDGDILVIQGNSSADSDLVLDLGGRHISNLTVTPGSDDITIIVKAASIDECYLLGSRSSITGYVSNAYVYDDTVATFCSDVDTLNVVGNDVEVHAKAIGCQGTVNHVIAKDDTWVRYEYWAVQKGKLEIGPDGRWGTEEGCYSTTPTAALNAGPAANNAANPYDKVPKTGSSNIIWLFVITAACCAGGLVVLKKSKY